MGNRIDLIPATPKDLILVVGLVGTYREGVPFDKEILIRNITEMIKLNQIIIVSSNKKVIGCVGGYVLPSLFRAENMFCVMLFYIKRGFRKYTKTVIKELEFLLIATNAKMITFGVPSDVPNSAELARYYEILGYKKFETHYCKRFDNG